MFKQTNKNSFFGYFLYDQIIPKNHFLKKLAAAVDFSFVNESCKDAYPNFGKPGNRPYEPVLLFKVMFLAFLYNISLRDMEEQINDRLSFKWFLRLAATDAAPDHSTIAVFRDQLEAEIFRTIFNQIIEIADGKGLIHERLKLLDSTAMAANVDLTKLAKDHQREDPKSYVDDNSPDKDARFGRKSDKESIYGYKQHAAIDADSGIIEAAEIVPANILDLDVVDPLVAKIKKSSDGRKKTKICANKGYDADKNHSIIENHNCNSFIIIKKNRKVEKLKQRMKSKIYKKTIAERYKIERTFAESKSNHGLAKCRWLGQWKTQIQAHLTAMVLNCKKIVSLTCPNFA